MKIKNISFIEAHIEKIVLGISVVVLFASVYFYVLGSPNAIDLDGEKVSPGEIDEKLLDQANRLKSNLQRTNPHRDLKQLKVPTYRENFENRTGLIPLGDSLQYALGNRPSSIGDTEKGDAPFYYVPKVPATTVIAAAVETNTILEDEIRDNEALGKMFTAGAPYDTQLISIAGTFPMKAMRNQLETVPSDGNIKSLKAEWWNELFQIIEIEVQRQVQNPDGTWGEATRVLPIPGTVNFVNRPESVPDSEGRTLLTEARKNRLAILQPAVPEMRREWKTPAGQATEENPDVKKAQEINNAINVLKRQIETQTKLLTRQNINANVKANIQARIDRLNNDRKEKEAQVKILLDRIRASKGEVELNVPGDKLIEAESVNFWAVDLTIEPNKTYRYRTRAHVTNPLYTLFSRDKIAPEQRSEYSKKFTLAGEWSGWSEAVTSPPMYYFYAMSGGKNPAPGKINFEIYRYYDGQMRKESFGATPGDPVGGNIKITDAAGFDKDVQFDPGMTLIDLEEIQVQRGLVMSRTFRVMLMDKDGNVSERIIATDRKDQKRLELEQASSENVAGK